MKFIQQMITKKTRGEADGPDGPGEWDGTVGDPGARARAETEMDPDDIMDLLDEMPEPQPAPYLARKKEQDPPVEREVPPMPTASGTLYTRRPSDDDGEAENMFADDDVDLDAADEIPANDAGTAPADAIEADEPAAPVAPVSDAPVPTARNIWDLEQPSADAPVPNVSEDDAPPAPDPEPVESLVAPRPTRKGGANRVKTRVLGFSDNEDATPDIFAQSRSASAPAETKFPVGWLVVVSGPGRGASFALPNGASKIGRGEDQTVRLDFGDTCISRDSHAAVAYDGESRSFFIGHGGKSNLVRLNGMPVLSTEPLVDGDLIRIGETTLRLVALCGSEFAWEDEDDEADASYAAEG